MTSRSENVGPRVQQVLKDVAALVPEIGLGPQPGEGLHVALALKRTAMRDTVRG
jgi:hypothetical protein